MLFQLHGFYTVIRSINVYYSLQIMRKHTVVTCFEIIIHDLIGGVNNNNYYYVLQLGCHPVVVVILHVYKI